MHELSIVQSVIEIVEENIKNRPRPRVKTVYMKVGKMANVLPDSLRFGFESLTSGTGLEGADLIIEDIPVIIKCRECSAETEVLKFNFICSGCKSTNVEMISGRELAVSEIELESDQEKYEPA